MNDLADAEACNGLASAWPSPLGTPQDTDLAPPSPSVLGEAESPALNHQPTVNQDPTANPEPSLDGQPTLPTAFSPQPAPQSAPQPAPRSALQPTLQPQSQSEPYVEPEAQPEVDVFQSAPTTGPSAVLSADAAMAPIDGAALSLPTTPPRPVHSEAAQVTADFFADRPVAGPRASSSSIGSRLVKTVVVLAVLGGLGYAGAVHGPGLYDEYIADPEPAETAAPLSFPRSRTTAPDVRTATFVLDGLDASTEATYTVTVDFDTRVSRVVIDRTSGPDLEVLTFSDDALVRRLDSSSWYQIERGSFPLDDQLQRSDWIRMIDDLLPPERRAGVVIDDSTVATIEGVTTRHLVLTLDPALLAGVKHPGEVLDPIGDITNAAETAESNALTDAAPTPNTDEPATGADTDVDAGPAIETVPVAGEPLSADAIQIELWVDGQGVVRRSVGADVLGANSITILQTSPDAWIPDYPDTTTVEPMTAAALLDLGL